jgi:hypothetical protein
VVTRRPTCAFSPAAPYPAIPHRNPRGCQMINDLNAQIRLNLESIEIAAKSCRETSDVDGQALYDRMQAMIELLKSTQELSGEGRTRARSLMKVDPIRAARRFGAFAVLTLRAIDRIRRGHGTGPEAAKHFEQVARAHRLRETTPDPKLVDMLIARVRQTRKEERRSWGEEGD